ncbi:hypothetical protein SDC9_141400 [bioreactor metagenome]|uniref:Uncharacterized protein n=1 Tax=bioreactor metagenome TaxID=1076179 RepID=A0A645DXJ5_9ZZZZ
MVDAVKRADDAAHRLRERAVKEGIAAVGQQAIHRQRFEGNVDEGCSPAAILVGIARRKQRAFVEMRGLNGGVLAHAVFVLPVFADFDDLSAKLVANDHRMFRRVLWHALVRRALQRGFIARHADAVGNHFNSNAVVADLRQVKRVHS